MVVILTVKHVVDDVAADYAMFLLTTSDAVLHWPKETVSISGRSPDFDQHLLSRHGAN